MNSIFSDADLDRVSGGLPISCGLVDAAAQAISVAAAVCYQYGDNAAGNNLISLKNGIRSGSGCPVKIK